MSQNHTETLFERVIRNEKRAVARVISLIESESPLSEELIAMLYKHTGSAYRIGITGPPGAGKSTLTNQLAKFYLSQGKKVGIIAVDPTSPFSGGALLGDRVRMAETGNLDGIFIRSMATRGSLGGLSKKAIDAADVLDAAGYDYILFETVGVGQSELDIVKAADTTLVVLVPESGDAVQAMKAGLMEIADSYIVNKSDRPGSEQAVSAIRTILGLRDHDEHSWMPDIIKAVASENKGTKEIAEEIARHHKYLDESGSFLKKRMERRNDRIKGIVETRILSYLWGNHSIDTVAASASEKSKSDSPYHIAELLLQEFKDNFTKEENT
ncbi:MAG: methylmalonyl Co-A mutase-associated GTPase MeaB [Ignavibacteriales bacterium]|nr:GTPase ArgK [Ignavibacteriaceae bacterium]QOJ29226.1 MAG: methylmalonyl Co-A mutase-associated GTPase MeaB [Ignavibacteriales bacterium]